MEFTKTSEIYSLNKSTYINLRWIAYIGQLTAIIVVLFILQFDFKYFACISVIFLSIGTNIYLQFRVKENQLNNIFSTSYLGYDIVQLTILFFFYWRNYKSFYISNYNSCSFFISIFKNKKLYHFSIFDNIIFSIFNFFSL